MQTYIPEEDDDAPQFELFEEEPTDEEIEWFAKKLGMTKTRDSKYFYLARGGILLTKQDLSTPFPMAGF